MRPIDADALIDKIKYITGQDTIMWFDDRKIKREQEVNMAALIERAPTIDPVKHGKWIAGKRGEWQTFDECVCSECGCVEYFNIEWKRFNYCPNCGADMRGE